MEINISLHLEVRNTFNVNILGSFYDYCHAISSLILLEIFGMLNENKFTTALTLLYSYL